MMVQSDTSTRQIHRKDDGKMIKKEVLAAFLCGMVLPLGLLAAAGRDTPAAEATQPTEPARPAQTLTVLTPQGTCEMELEEYLTGVLLHEMPVSFQPEALKAQAVVARTYAARRIGSGKHGTAAVCTESSCCQGYTDPGDYLAAGGTREGVDKAAQAARDTAGQVLTYEGQLIDATYFSCSGGSTESAVAVWGSDVPYLQATDSPGEEISDHYTDTVTFTAGEFAQRTGCGGAGDPADWFGSVTYTEGGGVDTMRICGETYEGTRLRQLLGLKSTNFTVSVFGDLITIETHGFGHRVGMSQYGAEAMAQGGSGYEEILAHYYQGTVLEEKVF